MAKKNIPQKEDTSIFEDPDALRREVTKLEEVFIKHKNLISIVTAAVIIGVAGIFYLSITGAEEEVTAQNDFFNAENYIAKDSFDLALNGNGNDVIGLNDIINDYDGTNAANIANFLAGIAYANKGYNDTTGSSENFASAIEKLEAFSSSDIVMQGKAYAALGDMYAEQGDADAAIDNFTRASQYKPNKYMTPLYLMKLGNVYFGEKRYEDAVQTYGQIVEEYPITLAETNLGFRDDGYQAANKRKKIIGKATKMKAIAEGMADQGE